jgi:hypothetical protein
MNRDVQVIWPTLGADVDSTDVRVQKGFMIHPSFLHSGNHWFAAEIAECGIVDLNVS